MEKAFANVEGVGLDPTAALVGSEKTPVVGIESGPLIISTFHGTDANALSGQLYGESLGSAYVSEVCGSLQVASSDEDLLQMTKRAACS